VSRKWISILLAIVLMFGQAAVAAAADEDTTAPIVQPDKISGVYNGPLTVTLTSNEPGTIYYTLDGSEPTADNYDGHGDHDGTPVVIEDFYTELRYTAVDAAGNWDDVKTERYKLSTDPVTVVPGTQSTEQARYYTNYVSVDDGSFVYVRKIVVRMPDNTWAYKYNEVHLRQGDADIVIADLTNFPNSPDEADFTGISGDHVIFGSESMIWHYSIASKEITQIYASQMDDPDISRAKISGNRLIFLEDYNLKVIDLSGDDYEVITLNDSQSNSSVYTWDAFDLNGDYVVWEEGFKVYLGNMADQSVETILIGIYPEHLMLSSETVYYASSNGLYAYNIATEATTKVVDKLSYGYLPYYTMELDKTQSAYAAFKTYDAGGYIGVLNIGNGVVKLVDLEGEYSILDAFAIDNGVVYWSKEHVYGELRGDREARYIDESPVYSLDYLQTGDSDKPEVSLQPDGKSFIWDGAAQFIVNEDAVVRYTLDGSEPAANKGYPATIFDKVPIFANGVVKYYAIDFAGNQSVVKTSDEFTVAIESRRVTDNDSQEQYAAFGSTIVYSDGTDLRIYDIPTLSDKLLIEDFSGEDWDFDGRYVVYSIGWFNPELTYLDLATGLSHAIPGGGSDASVKDGKVVYINTEGDSEGISVYDIATGVRVDLTVPENFEDIGNPHISGDLVVFQYETYDTVRAGVLRLDKNPDSGFIELSPPDTFEINQAVPMDDKVYMIADDDKKLFVYDVNNEEYTDLTADSGTAEFTDLSADKQSGRFLTLVDYINDKILMYDATSGQFMPIGSGAFYFYNPQLAGTALVTQGSYGLPIGEDEIWLRLPVDDKQAPVVTASPAGGSFNTQQTVSLTTDEAASIFYTLDGSKPTEESAKYYGPLTLTASTTIRLLAVDLNGNYSEETVQFEFDNQGPVITANPPAGTYNTGRTIKLESNETATIVYALGSLDNDPEWIQYDPEHGLSIEASTVLNYKGIDALGNESEIRSATYTIDPNALETSISPAAGLYHGDIDVTITVDKELEQPAIVYYTLDGTDPTETSTPYNGPITLTQTTTLKYLAKDAAGNQTQIVTVEYQINKVPPTAVVAPENESTRNLVTTPITATFGVGVSLHNANGVSLMLDGVRVPDTSASLSGSVLTIDHPALQKGKTYTVRIAADTVRNIHNVGNEAINWSFTTEYNLLTAELTPANGSSAIATDTPVRAVFSGAVTAHDLTGITISKNGNPLEGVEAALTDNVLTISHTRFEHDTTYKVTIPANALHNADAIGNQQIEWRFTTASAYVPPITLPTSQSPEPESPSERNDKEVVLDKKDYTLGSEKSESGQTITTVLIHGDAFGKAAEALKKNGAQSIVLQIDGISDATRFSLPASALAHAASQTPHGVLSVRTDEVGYDLPFGLLGLDKLAEQLGTGIADMQVSINMSKAVGQAASRAAESAKQAGVQLLGDLIEFTVTVEAGGQSREISEFGNTFVTRTIMIPQQVNASSATAVLIDPATGEMTFVPALFETVNGKTRVSIKRNGNSIYAVITADKTFADVAGHWAQSDIELLASKLLISGKGGASFAPNDAITRAEFAALIVRALGLAPDKAGADFADVAQKDWHAGVVGAAAKAGLVNGFADGTFRPNEQITREQMAVLIARAMAFAGKQADVSARQEALLAKFSDRGDISAWARNAVAETVEAGIVQGLKNGSFAAKAVATRAEAAVMLKRLLKFVAFID